MVEPARGTKASAQAPWDVYATAWELGLANNTPPQSYMALPTPYSTVRIAVRVSFGGVHTIFSS